MDACTIGGQDETAAGLDQEKLRQNHDTGQKAAQLLMYGDMPTRTDQVIQISVNPALIHYEAHAQFIPALSLLCLN